MKLLAGLLATSGAGWASALLLLNLAMLTPAVVPVVLVVACYLAVAAMLVATAKRPGGLPGRLLGLWLVLVVAVGAVLSPLGLGWPLVAAALTYGSVGFLLWVVPALVVYSFVRTVVAPRRREASRAVTPA